MNLTAIVIDDTAISLRMLTDILEFSGVTTLARGFNGKDAVDLYKKFKPDLVFSVLNMPKYDGIYALGEIRSINPNAKVIIITEDTNPKNLESIHNLKPYAIISKPFSWDDVQGILEKLSSSNQSWVSIAIERSLLHIGFDALNIVRQRLSDDYNRNFSDCYENPEFLNRILKDLYGDSYKAIVESIRKNLKDCLREEHIIKFEKEISK